MSVVRRLRRRTLARVVTVACGLAVAVAAIAVYSLSLGEIDIPAADVVNALLGLDDGGSAYIVNELRLPRALVAVLAGAAFGMSGAIFQSLVRNPLASPDIIGVTAGAGAAAVVALLLFGWSGVAVSAAALVGALATAASIYLLAWRDGVTGGRLVVIGIAMAAMLTGIVSFTMTRADVYDARDALVWLTGSLNAKTWATVRILAPALAVLFALALPATRWLRALRMSDEAARGIGVPVERARLGLIAIAVALAAVATAAVGPVAFVAFVSGPIARRLTGPGGHTALVPAALVGALVLSAADLVAQHAVASTAFPVGVVTAIVGAPYLLWLLARTGRE
ncbi:FecCD family ABC transporter permease [Phytomonospora endophytica]|uniref:Iron complex transport system permease protein n=1 Tax=Phytomonospora endophytica TaxID=714109 RepID=A0A841FLJ8_9ACTN|nr:iron chelate uptake ABC transporter family permease subunit [Phytomonospora endophytica]MBB6036734.1 iron complex transport system permease protein [Phytomonospora endophytica]GIG68232.1 ABC transporter permease [Phytomonospora endophytica]